MTVAARQAPQGGAPAIAVVAVVAPDRPDFHGPAFNRAAQMFQQELIGGLSRHGAGQIEIFSIEPIPAFPRSRRLWSRRATFAMASGEPVRQLPFVNVHPLKFLTSGASVLLSLCGWAWRNRKRQRLIHLINLSMPPGIFSWLAARLTGSRVSASVLDIWKPGQLVPDTWAWRADFALQRWLLPRLDGHAVVAQAIADDFLDGRPVCLVEGGISESKVPERPGVQTDAGGRPFRLVLSGSLEPVNGLELACAAMTHLPADYELVIAGAGSLGARAEALAAQDPRIKYVGFLSYGEVCQLYVTADLLLNVRLTQALDSRYFFPSKLFELLASGTPVLSTCTGHVESEYGHVLYLLKEETPAALAAEIMRIRARDPIERRRLGASAREYILREKTWHQQTRRLADYLRQHVLREERVA